MSRNAGNLSTATWRGCRRRFLSMVLCALACAALGAPLAPAGEHLLATHGKTDYGIVRPSGTPDSALATAVRDFARVFKRATSAELPIAKEGAAVASKNIFVGPTRFAEKNGVDAALLRAGEWVFKSVGDDIIIVGGGRGGANPGTTFAVYEFLEKYLGCLWLDVDTEIIPKASVLKIPELDVHEKAAFDKRSISIGSPVYFAGDQEKTRRDSLFAERNKYYYAPLRTGSPGTCHTFYYYSKEWPVTPSEHPEYYSMRASGKRNLPNYDGSKNDRVYGHLCLSNPEVPKLLYRQLKVFIERDREELRKQGEPLPAGWLYDISQNDPGGRICECPECMKIVTREGGTDAALLIHALNPIAEAIAKEYPDVLIQTFAYKGGIRPPLTLRPAENMVIRFADLGREWGGKTGSKWRDQLFPPTHPINQASYDNFVGWGRITKQISIWGYWGIYREKFHSPYVMTHCIKPDLETYHKNNVKYVGVELNSRPYATSFFALTRWLGFKLLQDPSQAREPLIETFMKGYYGPAAPFMLEYLMYLENRIMACKASLNGLPVDERPYLDLALFVKTQKLLDQAEAACVADPQQQLYLRHIKHERVPVDSALLHLWPKLSEKNGRLPFNRGEILARYKTNRIERARTMASAKYYQEAAEHRILKEFAELDPDPP